PVLEAQVAHAAAVVAAGAEAGGSAVHDPARQACPARGGAEIQGENCAARGCRDDRGRKGRAHWVGRRALALGGGSYALVVGEGIVGMVLTRTKPLGDAVEIPL